MDRKPVARCPGKCVVCDGPTPRPNRRLCDAHLLPQLVFAPLDEINRRRTERKLAPLIDAV